MIQFNVFLLCVVVIFDSGEILTDVRSTRVETRDRIIIFFFIGFYFI